MRGTGQEILISLKTRNFRLYFTGMCISLTGTWMQHIAMSWLTYKLTDSILLLATVTFMAQIPILAVTPFISVFADRFDRRKILFLTQTLSMIQALILALLTLSGQVQVWHLMALSLFIGCINALDSPTRQAFYPNLVDKEQVGNAIALNSAVINGSRFIGPAIGGVMISIFGEGMCFLLNAVSYTGVLAALRMMKLTSDKTSTCHRCLLTEWQEGFTYVAGSMPIRSLLILMSAISFFGLPLVTFIPAYVKDMLNGGSEMLGWMLSFVGIGSLGAALMLATRKDPHGLGKVVTVSGLLLGLCLLNIAFVTTPWMAIILCIPIGFCIISAVASINTLLQMLSDEDKRGRVMGYLTMAFTGMAPIGSMLLGSLEKYIGLPGIIFISGLCCLAAILIFECYRPLIYRHAHPIYVRKGLMPGFQTSPRSFKSR